MSGTMHIINPNNFAFKPVCGVHLEVNPVKSNTHPVLHATTVRCSCGNSFETLATKEDMRVEICSACHPFYTGKQRNVANEGQVEKFRQRYKNFGSKSDKD